VRKTKRKEEEKTNRRVRFGAMRWRMKDDGMRRKVERERLKKLKRVERKGVETSDTRRGREAP
jgi:hypothetical protein